MEREIQVLSEKREGGESLEKELYLSINSSSLEQVLLNLSQILLLRISSRKRSTGPSSSPDFFFLGRIKMYTFATGVNSLINHQTDRKQGVGSQHTNRKLTRINGNARFSHHQSFKSGTEETKTGERSVTRRDQQSLRKHDTPTQQQAQKRKQVEVLRERGSAEKYHLATAAGQWKGEIDRPSHTEREKRREEKETRERDEKKRKRREKGGVPGTSRMIFSNNTFPTKPVVPVKNKFLASNWARTLRLPGSTGGASMFTGSS